jgi:hypothetical protein
MSSVLSRLLGTDDLGPFFERHFGAEPLLAKGTAAWAAELASLDVCERLVTDPRVDVLFARQGEPFDAPRPDLDGARRLFACGHTWVMRDVDRGADSLAELGRGLASDVHGTLHLQLYRTPPARFGFGWHFDPEEVFYVQASGRKRLRLRRNTQHPAPLAHAMPTFLTPDTETTPVVEHVLEPGDCLYIPSGWWHTADALDDDTISISAGVRAPALVDALSLVLADLAKDPAWRARLASHRPREPADRGRATAALAATADRPRRRAASAPERRGPAPAPLRRHRLVASRLSGHFSRAAAAEVSTAPAAARADECVDGMTWPPAQLPRRRPGVGGRTCSRSWERTAARISAASFGSPLARASIRPPTAAAAAFNCASRPG